MRSTHAAIATTVALFLAGCAQTPTNPQIAVAPNQGKSFEAFQADQYYCKQFAQSQVAGQAEHANRTQMLGTGGGALGGAALGAAGGAIGGNAGAGAAIGALTGVVLGTAGGAIASNRQQETSQRLYDQAYGECMYSRGNNVQGFPPHAQSASTLSPSNPALIRSVQDELIRLRYLAPPADGIAGPQTISAITGPQTISAITRFQEAAGMQPTGEASPTLLARLQSTPAR